MPAARQITLTIPWHHKTLACRPAHFSSQRSDSHAVHRRSCIARAEDDVAPALVSDWRDFRARLIAETAGTAEASGSRICEDNLRRLQIDNPQLASEGVWCHPTGRPEKGGLLIATLDGPKRLKNKQLKEVVVLLVEHGEEGSIGLILNRPSIFALGRRPSGYPFKLRDSAPDEVEDVFQDNQVYCGGFGTWHPAQRIIHVVHGHNLPGAQEVVPGIYTGGELVAAEQVGRGQLPAHDFRFFACALLWGPGELDQQALDGCWYTAACSRALVLKQCLQLPTPLWQEVLLLLGGDYAKVADDAYDPDKV